MCYDCHMGTPVLAGVEGNGNAYYFRSDATGEGLGKTYLYNCSATDCETALYIDTASHITNINKFKHDGVISNVGTLNYI